MVVVDRQRRAAREPQDLSALDLDRGREGHEHALVVVRVVDGLQVVSALCVNRCGDQQRGGGEQALHGRLPVGWMGRPAYSKKTPDARFPREEGGTGWRR